METENHVWQAAQYLSLKAGVSRALDLVAENMRNGYLHCPKVSSCKILSSYKGENHLFTCGNLGAGPQPANQSHPHGGRHTVPPEGHTGHQAQGCLPPAHHLSVFTRTSWERFWNKPGRALRPSAVKDKQTLRNRPGSEGATETPRRRIQGGISGQKKDICGMGMPFALCISW